MIFFSSIPHMITFLGLTYYAAVGYDFDVEFYNDDQEVCVEVPDEAYCISYDDIQWTETGYVADNGDVFTFVGDGDVEFTHDDHVYKGHIEFKQ